MYNLASAIPNSPLAGIDMGSNTPRTPEILNSLIAMTNPFEYSSVTPQLMSTINPEPSTTHHNNNNNNNIRTSLDDCKIENYHFDNSSQSNTSSSSSSEFETLHSKFSFQQVAVSISSTPSLQQTRSQLIKAGVKLLIQNKRKNSRSSCDAEQSEKIRVLSPSNSDGQIENNEENRNYQIKTIKKRSKVTSSCDESFGEQKSSSSSSRKLELTNDDEDRRKRRRERNKIAATKCRLKKRECINNLMKESECLETQNIDLKSQLKDLKEQYQYLTEMWQAHQLECSKKQSNNLVVGSKVVFAESSEAQFSEQNKRATKSKDNNNNKSSPTSNIPTQLPSFSPLINCNLSFDFY